MTKPLCLALFLFAPLLHGETIRVRATGASVTIIGGDALRAAGARRVDAHTIEIDADDGASITAPRTASVELIARIKVRASVRDVAALHLDLANGSVDVERVRGNLDGKSVTANVTARDVGGNVVLSTGNGNITLERVGGLVDVTSGNGNTIATNVRSSAHVVSINGKTRLGCIGGNVDVQDTSGQTVVSDVAGDVTLFTALGKANYEGLLHADRSYRLRTLDGAVGLAYAPNGSGFSAQLASDAGQIELDRPLQGKQRRTQLRVGDERARVVLDAFGGRVALRRGEARTGCR
ncbi:MAG TPA: hypothetical protein VF824_09575 [Thermoanaerobaculia bacterium]|jgi:hypothetical protein